MNPSRSYLRGILTVVTVVLASAALVVAGARSNPGPPRAAQDLGDQAETLGRFQLVERSGRSVTESDLMDRVCIVSFIFTRCQLSCPRISSVMKSLQERLQGSPVLLVSLSVDPEHDTPQILEAYARSFKADPARWWFLTGPRPEIYELIQRRFRLSVSENPVPDPDGRSEAIAHSDRLALVERGRIVGLFDSSEATALNSLVSKARLRAAPAWVRTLPSLNASLNGLCAVFLVLGWLQIRRGVPGSQAPLLSQPRVRGHITCMILAVITSAVFLGCYLVYHYQAGSVPFEGQGLVRYAYFTVLLSHTVLATFGVVPLVILTLLRAWRRDFARHRSIAAVTFPIWLYVSVTGVMIYWMLYQMPVPIPWR
jgi:protein SCO1/2/putative membrane protein